MTVQDFLAAQPMATSQWPDCQLTYADGMATCAVCGRTYKAPKGRLRANCKPASEQPQAVAPQPVLDAPSFLQKAKNFAKAAVSHIAAGMPLASDEEIDRRFAICQKCPLLKDNACTKCGCPVAREKKFISKLAWADQKCPEGHW